MTTIHVVLSKFQNTGKQKWFWNRPEADSFFYDEQEANGKTHHIEVYALDIDDLINGAISDLINAGEGRLEREHKPDEPEKPEYTTLRYDTQNHEILYIERTFGGEFWPYTVEKRSKTSWTVLEDGQRIGRVYQDDPTALLPSYSVEIRADRDPVGYGTSLQEAVEKLIGTVSGDFGDVE